MGRDKGETQGELVVLDARLARFLAGLARDHAGLELVAELIASRAEDVFVTPPVGAWVLGCSVPLLRQTADAAGHEVGKHRAIRLAALGRWTGTTITAQAIAAALVRAVDAAHGFSGVLEEYDPDAPIRLSQSGTSPPPPPIPPGARLVRDIDLSQRYGYPARLIA